MKIIQTLLLLCSFSVTFSQQNEIKIDTLELQESFKKIKTDGSEIHIDSTQKRSFIKAKQIKNVLSSYQNKNDKNYKVATDIYYQLQNVIMFTYVVQNQYDSVVKLQQLIEKKSSNKTIKGDASLYRAYAESDKNNTVESLKYIEKANKYFKLSGDKQKEWKSFITLIIVYIKNGEFTTAKQLLDIFEKENDIENLPLYIKGQFKTYNALVASELDGNEKAIAMLKNIDVAIFNNNSIQNSNYYLFLTEIYIRNKEYNKALETITGFKNTYKLQGNGSTKYHNLSAEIYLALKNYPKTLYHLKENEKILSQDQLANDLNYQRVFYKYYKAKNDYNKALTYFETLQSKNDSINSKQYKLRASILNYRLKKESELVRLEEEALAKDLNLVKNKKLYTYIALISSIAAGTFIFFIMLYYKKRKTLKLKLENSKKEEIAIFKNRYIENLSHEIRTPLTIIQGYVALIRHNVFNSANIIKYADKTLESTDNIIRALNDFLTILNLEKKEFISQNSSKNIGYFLNDLVESFQGIASLKNIKLNYKSNIKKSKIETIYDYASLEKIISNLLSNAVKFSNVDSAIYVEAILNNQELKIIVKDEGVGIAKKDLPKIFSRFFQAKKDNSIGGFGIGLSLAHDLIKNLKGDIHVISEEEVGTIFTISLPLVIHNYSLQLKKHPIEYVLINEEILK